MMLYVKCQIKTILLLISISTLQSMTLAGQSASISDNDFEGIKPYAHNQWYWQYRGEPIILMGGSNEDNLYQWTGKQLTDHLDLLVSVGGNYLRNTMSDRDEGNCYAFKKGTDNKYNLNQWNDKFWNRLTFFLDETSKRGIIVQLTLWDQYDILSSRRWKVHPWNPDNNINMESGTWKNKSDFYSSVERNAKEEIKYQEGFINKLLSISLRYDNVLYNINNESSESGDWEIYWAKYIKNEAIKAGKKVYITNMQMSPSDAIRHVLSNRDIFDFVDISQNNQDYMGGKGQSHWDNLMFLREKIVSTPMPMNNVKVYGSVDGRNYTAGSESEALDRFWRNIFGGCASSRFHRPGMPSAWGAGLNERVQINLKAMSMLLEEVDIMSCTPHNDLLSPQVQVASTMEAYTAANIGHQYAIYFPSGRYTINLDPWVYVDKLKLRWLDINNLKWSEPKMVEVKWKGNKLDWGYQGIVTLKTPGTHPCVALLEVVE